MTSESVASVLAEIAEAASETLELQEVFNRIATSVRRLIPFYDMGVVRIQEGELAVAHATTVDCSADTALCWEPIPLTAWSRRVRPRLGPIRRIDDAETELDPSFPKDAALIDKGVQSALWQSFRSGDSLGGGVWLSSLRKNAFTEEHQQTLRPIAALLGSAVEHWRIWDLERRRRERLDELEVVLGTLAESLDIRDVFERVSEGIRPVLAHDLLALTEFDKQNQAFRVVTFAGMSDGAVPNGPVPLTDDEVRRRAEYEIFRDIPAEIDPVTDRNRLLLGTGMRSWLRVPIVHSGEMTGSIVFLHREAERYDENDVEVARRAADRIAVALSHHRLSEEARLTAEACERAQRLEATVETLTRELDARGRGRVVGVSRSWKNLLRQVGRVASADTTVLVLGESGTGKEVVSHLIHQGSNRSTKPFVAINCATLTEQLLESELFGHEKGAFTGAVATKIGRLEQAAEGTLFLDEIAEMSPMVQAKLLRVLQEHEFERLGGTRTIPADVRVIAATNRDLAAAIARGEFREDLYYRLNVFAIHVPSLRDRSEDILPLAESFLVDLGSRMGRPAAGISRGARAWLLEYAWPGNVRELRNAIERAILLCDGGLITRSHLPAGTARPPNSNGSFDPNAPFPASGLDLEALDRSLVEKALQQTKGNKSKAARLLGLTRSQLYSRLGKYELNP